MKKAHWIEQEESGCLIRPELGNQVSNYSHAPTTGAGRRRPQVSMPSLLAARTVA